MSVAAVALPYHLTSAAVAVGLVAVAVQLVVAAALPVSVEIMGVIVTVVVAEGAAFYTRWGWYGGCLPSLSLSAYVDY